ncbi:MAG: M28 family peptidase [Chloroflexi bacterium]|nr:M28 family peptidase [Chloroflexota bacterium]
MKVLKIGTNHFKFKQILKPSWLQVAGVFIICCGISLFSAMLHTVEVTSTAEVAQHWRGKYDILVRPASSVSDVERDTRLVEGNYLGSSYGGITDEQYALIRSIDEVEVAAPVATVGYFVNSTGAVFVRLDPGEVNTLYRITFTWSGDDPTLQDEETQVAYFATTDFSRNYILRGNLAVDLAMSPAQQWALMNIGIIPSQWVLVAGIDPEQEAQLIGLDTALLAGDYLEDAPLEEGLENRTTKKVKIPLIINNQNYTELGISMKIEALPLEGNAETMKIIQIEGGQEWQTSLRQIYDARLDAEGQLLLDEQLDLSVGRKPLAIQSVVFNTSSAPEISSDLPGSAYTTGGGVNIDRDITLLPGSYSYEAQTQSPFSDGQPLFALKPFGTWGEMLGSELEVSREGWGGRYYENMPLIPDDTMLYRPLQVVQQKGFMFDVKGIYDLSVIHDSIDELTYAPLGIYDPPMAELQYDESAQPLAAQTILPGLNPGALVTRPPLALTNLQGARYLSGREDYIDAIRVRVAGMEGYSEENLHKVERVASEISERTGLHVDVIAGSSPRDVWVHVPGMGYLEEAWTTLGAVQHITQGINAMNIALLMVFLIVAGVFIAFTTNVSLMSRIEEIGVLRAVGWRKTDVFRYLLSELIAIGWIGAISAAGFSLLLTHALEMTPSPFPIIGTALAIPLLYTVSGIPVIRRVVQKTPYELLQRGEFSHQPRAAKRTGKKLTFSRFFLNQFTRRRNRNIFTSLTFSAAIALLNLVVNILLNLQGILQVTLLGQFIALRLRAYHFVIVGIALVMGMLVMYENLMLGVRERENEFKFLHAAGWKKHHISRWIVLESAFLSGLGGIVGSTLGTLIFWVFSGTFTTNMLVIFAASLLGSLLIGIVIAVQPARKIPQRLFLRYKVNGEGTGKKTNPLLLVALLLVILAGITFWVGRGSLLPQSWSRSTPAEETLYDQFGIDSAAMMTTIENISGESGETLSGSTASKTVAEIIQTLESYGVAIRREWVPLQTLTIYAADGVEVDTIDGTGSSSLGLVGTESNRLISIAAHLGNLQEYAGKKIPLLYKPDAEPWQTADVLRGKIVLVDGVLGENDPLNNGIGAALAQDVGLAATAFTVSADLNSEMKAILSTRQDLSASVVLGEAISGVIPGQDHPEKEIWIITHYGSSSNSPGADQNASGIATMLELARMFKNDPPAYSVRFIFLPAQGDVYSGLTAYLQLHTSQASHLMAVFDIAWTGNWEKILVSEYLDEMEPYVDATRMEDEGQYFVQMYWTKSVDLDEDDILENFTQQVTRRMGLSESPAALQSAVEQAGERLGIPLTRSLNEWYFPLSLSILLSDDLPAVGIYGAGNDMLGSEYDDLSTIQEKDLVRATALIYQSVQNVMGEER